MSRVLDRIEQGFTSIANRVANGSGQPLAFMLAMGVVLVWALAGWRFGYNDDWRWIIDIVTTVVTFLMVFLIQNSQNRDTASMQAKMDELLRALEGAREDFIGIEHMTASEVETVRDGLEREVDDGKPGGKDDASDRSVETLAKEL